MECEFCDCIRNIKLQGKSLVEDLGLQNDIELEKYKFLDIRRIKLNRKKQKVGMQGLRNTFDNSNEKIRPILVGAAISGLFAIFYDENEEDHFRVKEIPDTKEARQILQDLNLKVNDDVHP